MTRLAWFTPLPPVRSGISAYSEEILPLLRRRRAIDVFDEPAAHDFAWRHARQPYDLVVYQLGNASCHDYMWPYLIRHPGLVVLHDAQLHQSRALALLLRRQRPDDYRAEFAFNHPGVPEGVAGFVTQGHCRSLFHFWPMLRLVVSRSRAVAVHDAQLAASLGDEFPDATVDRIRMGVKAADASGGGRALRQSLDVPESATVFAAFGKVTPEKRISQILHAFAALIQEQPAHLLLVGEAAEYYDAAAECRTLEIGPHVTITGYVDDSELSRYLDLADACLSLRWPTSRETSASWLRCLAAGKPTIITELSQTAGLVTLDPRTWLAQPAQPDHPTAGIGPVAIGVDLTDEEYSIWRAMRRLIIDPTLREELGANGRRYWEREHTLEAMAADYDRVIVRALAARPGPLPDLPHLRADGTALLRDLLAEVGTDVDPLG